ncbi:MAG: hypothetical protein JSV89_11185 [Spirochaetaceae bacterium]|nr:MAG: hypothetical protein JSV89_11185 [Spirochaetaceae bacterium]
MINTLDHRKTFQRSIFLVLILCLYIAPVVAQQQSADSGSFIEEYNQGWIDGQADAEGNGVWVLSGLLLGPIGIILPWVINPKVPGTRLIGKSVAYVEGYTDGYRQKAKPKNFYYSLIGFGVWAVAVVIGGVLAVRAAESAADSCGSTIGQNCSDSCSQTFNCSPDLGCSSQ